MRIAWHWLLVCYLLKAASCFSQNTVVEYFIDNDPGIGNANSAGAFLENVTFDFNVPLPNISEGYHILYWRAKGSNGLWSHTSNHPFYVQRKAASVSYVEYFIDNDPGYGKATGVSSLLQNETIDFVIPLTEVEHGFHRLNIRSKDDQGVWSLTANHIFFVSNSTQNASIKSIAYYFENGTERSETMTYSIPSPSPLVDAEFTADVSSLAGNKEYTMYFWAINNENIKSPIYTKKIKVCNDLPTKARFDYIGMGTSVSFIDSSENVVNYRWDFGDGKTDTVSNPVHDFETSGFYNVRLITDNYCNSDTATAQLSVIGVSSIHPTRGGNTGSVTLTISGDGFTENTTVTLVREGKEIKAISTAAEENGKSLHAMFELYDQQVGGWDVVVVDDNTTVVNEGSFVVEAGRIPKTKIDIKGRNAIRVGVAQKYNLIVTNESNIDAKGLPIWFAVPQGSLVNYGFPIITYNSGRYDMDTVGLHVPTDSLFGMNLKADVYGFFVKKVPASSSLTFEIEITVYKEDNIELYAWTKDPYYGSPLSPFVPPCIDNVLDLVGLIPSVGCIYAVVNKVLSPFVGGLEAVEAQKQYKVKYPEGEQSPLTIEKIFDSPVTKAVMPILQSTVDIVFDCTTGTPGKLFEIAKKSYEYYNKGKAVISCAKFGWENLQKLEIRAVTSFDPNEKVGPRGRTSENFVLGQSNLNYQIYFENLPSASAPAQEVIILDTLDKHTLDLSTFRFHSISLSKISVQVPEGLSEYFTDVDLRPTKNMLVRVNAKLDSVQGVLTWRFLSIDPDTRELIDDPLDGFLPPNRNSPEGEGFVSFSVRPKDTLPFGTKIENKATIYFDANAPIVTNTFLNTIDRVSPASTINPLTATLTDTVFTVSWGGNDQGAGVRSYDVYYAINNNAFKLWQYDVVTTESIFIGKKDSLYSFYSIAKDYAGNIESAKQQGEASTQIITSIDDFEEDALVKCFPNPFDNTLTLEFNLRRPTNVKAVFKNIQGQEILKILDERSANRGYRFTVSTAHLPQGFYLCEITFDNARYISKLIKL